MSRTGSSASRCVPAGPAAGTLPRGTLAARDRAARHEEPQHVAGFPVDWFSGAGPDWLESLAHPVREFRRWLRRRPPGPPAAGDD